VPVLVFGLIVSVIGIIVAVLAMALAPDSVSSYESYGDGYGFEASSSFGPASMTVFILGGLVLLVLSGAFTSAYMAGLLDIANGQPVTIGSFVKPRNIASVIITTLIVGILTGIGYFLCVLPGLVVAVFSMFAIVAVVDRNLSPIDAIKASLNTVKDNLGPAVIAFLVILLIMLVGSICYIGLLVAFPVAQLLTVYTWRRLTGAPVAPATP
jgi:uncharacterized membrane protein